MKSAHLSRLDLNLLKVFAAVHRERHITRAGRALFISQSAVSHSLAKLRQLFGDPLFVRTPDGMQPTVLADRLASPIRQALQCVSDAMQVEQRFDPAAADIEFTLGTTTMQPFHFLPDFYRRFEREAPHANLLIRTLPAVWPEILNSLDHGDVDLLLTVAQGNHERALEPQRFRREILFDDPLVCVVSADNELVGEMLDIETYAQLPHLIMASDRVARTWIDDALEKRGLRRRIAVTAPHPSAIPLLMGGTRLVSTIARSLVQPYVDYGQLRLLAPPVTGTPHSFQMIWSTRMDRDAALTWLRATIRESCRPAGRAAAQALRSAPRTRPRPTSRGSARPARGRGKARRNPHR